MEAVRGDMEDREDIREELKEFEKNTHQTFISKCFSILVRMKFIPLKRKVAGSTTFHILSVETLCCFLLYYVTSILLFCLSFLFFRVSMNANKSQTLDSLELTDFVSYLGFNLTNFFLFPLLPIILGSAAAQVLDISLSSSLPWPRLGIKIIICEFFTALGYALTIIPSILHYAAESFKENCLYIILSIMCLSIVCIIVVCCVISSQVLIFSWMDKLASIAEDTDDKTDITKHARNCVEQYNNLNEGLSVYFFFNFAVLQFSWIFSAYLSVTNLINLDEQLVKKRHGSMLLLSMKSSGMFIMSLCCLWHLLHMVGAAENLKKR